MNGFIDALLNTIISEIYDDAVYKQVIIVRTDLKMGKGKIAAQVAHASLCAFLRANKTIKEKWLEMGAAKIVLKVDSKQELLELYAHAKNMGVPYCLIKDAAKTQLKKPDYTALGIGPAKAKEIDNITGKLKLLWYLNF